MRWKPVKASPIASWSSAARAPRDARILDVTITPLAGQITGTHLLLELADTTQRQRISRENDLLARLDGSRLMIRQLAHEIKNPLGGLRGAAQLLERELQEAGLKEYTRVIIGEADRLHASTRTLCHWSRSPPRTARMAVRSVRGSRRSSACRSSTDRAIPAAVAQTLAVPLAEVETRDEVLGGFLERLLGTFAQMGGIHGGAIAPLPDVPDEAAFRVATERILREHAASDGGVILGRAGMIVLADQPGVLRVRLTSPVEARIEQAIRSNGLTAEAARRECDGSDAARAAYVHRFYGVDIRDPALYDLVINATRWTVSGARRLDPPGARGGFELSDTLMRGPESPPSPGRAPRGSRLRARRCRPGAR